MRSKNAITFILAVLIACGSAMPVNAGSLIRFFYGGDGINDIPGTEVAALKGNVNYLAGRFTSYESLGDYIEGSVSSATLLNYGSEIKGWLEAPQTGTNYYFWIASADSSELWLSTDVTPAKAIQIASVTGKTAAREYTKFATQKSAPVSLVKGNKYYFQVIQKAGGAGNGNVSIGWQLPDGTVQQPISSIYAQNYTNAAIAPQLTVPLSATNTVNEGDTIVLSVGVDASQPVTYRWYLLTSPTIGTDITYPGEVLSSFTHKVTLAENRKWIGVHITNPLGQTNSSTYMEVTPDKTPPTILSAGPRGNPYKVTVVYSEDLDPATATNTANYSIRDLNNTAAAVTGARMTAANTVELTTALSQGNLYTLTVNNVRDLAATPNRIATNSRVNFVLSDGAVQVRLFNTTTTNAVGSVGDITNNLALLNGPADRTFFNTSFETPSWDNGSNYLGQIQGYVTAPVSGEYMFGISSSDASLLYLSLNGAADNQTLVATVNTSTAQREFNKTPEQVSTPVSLVGGNRYYLQALFKKNGAGGGVSVAWQMPGGEFILNNSPAIPADYISAVKKTGNVKITNQPPAVVNAIEGGSALLTIGNDGVDGTPLYYYQWLKNGKAIDGATSPSYTTPAIVATDNGAVYTLVVSNVFSSTVSSNCVLHVDADVTPPTVAGAGSIKPPQFSVRFSENLNAASATNTTNFVLTTSLGAPVAVTSAVLSAKGDSVTLTAPALAAGSRYNLAISGVKDASARANTMLSTNVAFTPMDLVIQNINNNQDYSVALAGDQLDILAGGAGTSAEADQFLYAYMPVTNDFDFRLQIDSLPVSANWALCGLMARESAAPGSRFYFNAVASRNGRSAYWPQWRDGTDDTTTSDSAARPAAALPNAWVRLVRDGNVFSYYRSVDGSNWTLFERLDSAKSIYGPLPEVLLIGVATTSQNAAGTIQAVASNFEAIAEIPVKIVNQPPAALAAFTYHPIVIQVGAEGSHIKYQWRKDGVDIADATEAVYTVDQATLGDSGAYSVRVYNRLNEIVSSNCVVTVTVDSAPPVISRVKGSMSLDKVTVSFNERVDGTNAIDMANYLIQPDLAIIDATLENGTNVVLTTSLQTPATVYTLSVSGVTDLAQNMIAAGASKQFSSYSLVPGFAVMELFYNVSSSSTLADFVAGDKFTRNKPDALSARPVFSSPWNSASDYAGRLWAILTAPETGDYRFYIASDSQSVLYVSSDDRPVDFTITAPTAQVSESTGWTSEGQWEKSMEQGSTLINLTQGQKYYVYALWKTGGGPGDGCSVGWTRPSQPDQINVIPGEFLSVYIDPTNANITISEQPQSMTVPENRTATFSIGAFATWDLGASVDYQWQLNGTNIAGATNATYTTPILTMADSGAKYSCVVSIPIKSVTSETATLTVSASTGDAPDFDSIIHKGSTVILTWSSGILQSSDVVDGVYTDVPGATSPYTVPSGDSKKFFRLRSSGATSQARIDKIVRSGTTVTVTWTGSALQAADAVTGVYADIPGAVSPYTTQTTSAKRFFRARSN